MLSRCFYFAIQLFSFLTLAATYHSAAAKPSANVKFELTRQENKNAEGTTLVLPYFFDTQDMGTNYGIGVMRSGFLQDQMTVGATYFDGDSQAAAIGAWDWRLPGTDRLYLSAMGMSGDYPVLKAYAVPQAVSTPIDQARAGSNQSTHDDFYESVGSSSWSEVRLEYVLPIGAAQHHGWLKYETLQGMRISTGYGGEHWNPLKSGVTVVALNYTMQSQSFQRDSGVLEGNDRSYELGILYDNTDFPTNPSYGSYQYLAYSHSGTNSDFTWSAIEAEGGKYWSLGTSKYAMQRVIAANTWFAYSPTWQYQHDSNGEVYVENAPPFVTGAVLGGRMRMRGFEQNRFHDKTAIYATAEYRYTLKWNPINKIKIMRPFKVDWIQMVTFIEGGRVAPKLNADIFEDWQFDVGIALRAMASGIVLRMDITKSTEGTNLYLMVGHPF